mmetsp:Transcript_14277/g.29144  ORF Transcript_14277/g.29144 Transcript_14277/m.29144 type:complete len:419 (-) Transcript_14277:1140-2396(-)
MDPMGMDAFNRALSTRIKRLPADRMHNIDGCITILDPPDTSDQVQPSTIVKEVEDILKSTKAMKDIFQLHIFDGDEVPFQNKTVDELRTNSSKGSGAFLDAAMMLMWSHSFEDCIDGFSHPNKEDCGVDELIDDFINLRDVDVQKRQGVCELRDRERVCLFAGIVRALNDLKDYREKQDNKKSAGVNDVGEEERDSEGHLLHQDEEPEMYHGWSGSWAVDDNRPSKNATYYGVKLGTILDYAKQQAKKMVKKAPSGPKYALPRAKFHQDMSADDEGGRPKASNQATTPNDFVICRAKHGHIDYDTFSGDFSSIYSSSAWVHDGSIGFFTLVQGGKIVSSLDTSMVMILAVKMKMFSLGHLRHVSYRMNFGLPQIMLLPMAQITLSGCKVTVVSRAFQQIPGAVAISSHSQRIQGKRSG